MEASEPWRQWENLDSRLFEPDSDSDVEEQELILPKPTSFSIEHSSPSREKKEVNSPGIISSKKQESSIESKDSAFITGVLVKEAQQKTNVDSNHKYVAIQIEETKHRVQGNNLNGKPSNGVSQSSVRASKPVSTSQKQKQAEPCGRLNGDIWVEVSANHAAKIGGEIISATPIACLVAAEPDMSIPLLQTETPSSNPSDTTHPPVIDVQQPQPESVAVEKVQRTMDHSPQRNHGDRHHARDPPSPSPSISVISALSTPESVCRPNIRADIDQRMRAHIVACEWPGNGGTTTESPPYHEASRPSPTWTDEPLAMEPCQADTGDDIAESCAACQEASPASQRPAVFPDVSLPISAPWLPYAPSTTTTTAAAASVFAETSELCTTALLPHTSASSRAADTDIYPSPGPVKDWYPDTVQISDLDVSPTDSTTTSDVVTSLSKEWYPDVKPDSASELLAVSSWDPQQLSAESDQFDGESLGSDGKPRSVRSRQGDGYGPLPPEAFTDTALARLSPLCESLRSFTSPVRLDVGPFRSLSTEVSGGRTCVEEPRPVVTPAVAAADESTWWSLAEAEAIHSTAPPAYCPRTSTSAGPSYHRLTCPGESIKPFPALTNNDLQSLDTLQLKEDREPAAGTCMSETTTTSTTSSSSTVPTSEGPSVTDPSTSSSIAKQPTDDVTDQQIDSDGFCDVSTTPSSTTITAIPAQLECNILTAPASAVPTLCNASAPASHPTTVLDKSTVGNKLGGSPASVTDTDIASAPPRLRLAVSTGPPSGPEVSRQISPSTLLLSERLSLLAKMMREGGFSQASYLNVIQNEVIAGATSSNTEDVKAQESSEIVQSHAV